MKRLRFAPLVLLGCTLHAAGQGASFDGARLVRDARQQIGITTSYDPAYRALPFPMGDVPAHTGVCTDVIVRAYRRQGIDLQALVHQDMRRAFAAYPRHWGLHAPDRNIDHRRVPNLQVFFARHGQQSPAHWHRFAQTQRKRHAAHHSQHRARHTRRRRAVCLSHHRALPLPARAGCTHACAFMNCAHELHE